MGQPEETSQSRCHGAALMKWTFMKNPPPFRDVSCNFSSQFGQKALHGSTGWYFVFCFFSFLLILKTTDTKEITPKLSGSERNCSGRWTWATCGTCKKWGLDLSRFHIGWFVDVIPSNIKKCSCRLGWLVICLRMIFWWLEWDVYVEYIFLGGITTRMNQVKCLWWAVVTNNSI